jgi:hypothetical protein
VALLRCVVVDGPVGHTSVHCDRGPRAWGSGECARLCFTAAAAFLFGGPTLTTIKMTDGQERVRLRAREGEAVEWTRRVAQRAGTLKDMMDDAPTEDGVYPVPTIAAAELAVLREMCEADSMPARLEQCSISELFRLVEGASFLDAPGALNHAQRALASRLNGKRADELRELLGATDDFGSAENRVAALAEPAFSPEGQLSVAAAGSAAGPPALQPQLTLGYAGGAPALQPQPSLSGMAVTDDAKEAALGMVDVGTLAELKGVNRLWLALARRVLCSRLSRCEGQPAPTQLAEITDLNIKVLVDAGRPWEAAAAGRMLPSLARLRWEGFEVNVAAVREVDLNERPFLGGPAKTALISCIEGEGEPPLELLLAAVACAGSGEISGIPVQMMRGDSVSELDLQARSIGVEGGMLLAYLVPVMGGLTSLDLSSNRLCGLDRYNGRGTYTAEGITAIADALRVRGGLTALDLSYNRLEDEGVSAVCKAIQSNKETKLASLNFDNNWFGPVGANAVAAMVAVTGGLTALDLSCNDLKDEGVSAVCEAIQSNKETKLASLNFGDNDIHPVGANAVAAMVAVTGGLTALDLSGNDLKDEGVSAVCEAIQNNKETKLASLNMSFNSIGLVGAKSLAAMLAVTGGLTVIDLSGNQLCGIWTDWRGQHGTYTAEGITAIADALRVNGALTRVDVRRNNIAGDGAAQLSDAVLGNLKIEMFNGIPIKEMRANSIMELDLKGKDVGVEGGMIVAGLIPVMGGLTSINLSDNQLCGVWTDYDGQQGTYTAEGITAIADAMRVNGVLTSLNLSSNQLCGLDRYGKGTYTAEGITAIADALRVNGGLTSINMSGNNLTDSGRDMTGIKELAAALGVNGGLTMINLLGNQLDAESAKILAEVAKQKGISLCGIRRDQTTADFSNKLLKPPDAILLASDLSQAVVTGALTKIE